MSHKWWALQTFGAFVVLGALGGCAASDSTLSAAASNGTPVRSAIAVPTASATSKQAVQAYMSSLASSAAAVATAPGAAAVKASLRPPPAAGEASTRPSGLSSGSNGPMHAAQFTTANIWQGEIGQQWLLLLAGTTVPGGAGAIAVYSLPPNPQDGSQPTFIGLFSDSGTTKLTITSVDSGSETVSLVSNAGGNISFDLRKDTFG